MKKIECRELSHFLVSLWTKRLLVGSITAGMLVSGCGVKNTSFGNAISVPGASSQGGALSLYSSIKLSPSSLGLGVVIPTGQCIGFIVSIQGTHNAFNASLSQSGSAQFFSDSNCQSSISQVSFTSSESSLIFYLKDNAVETATIAASSSKYGSASFVTEFTLASPSPTPTVTVTATPSPSSSYAAARIVQSAVSQNVFCTTCTLTLSQPVTRGDAILVWMAGQGSSQLISSVTDSEGNNYAAPTTAACQNASSSASGAYALNTLGGSAPVMISIATQSTVYHGYFVVVEVSGLALSNALDQASCNANTSGTNLSSGSVVTSTNGEYISGFFTDGAGDSATMSAGAGFTAESTVSDVLFYEDGIQGGAGSISATASASIGSPFAASVMTYKPLNASSTPLPSSTPSPTPTTTATPTPTPSKTVTSSPSPSPTQTASPTPTSSPTPSSTATSSSGTTYYVDYTNGLDTNNGTSKSSPWKHAPGMYTCSGICASTAVHPGDFVILKGCVSWLNEAFPWTMPFSGSSGNPIYVGVDKTWWDSTVSGCSTSWNRPILNLQGKTTDPGSSGIEVVINSTQVSYVTWDNFEIINWYTYPDTTSGSHQAEVFYVSSASHGASYLTVENMYVHAWINPFISIGTGNITAGSCTITNYVPYSYSNAPSAAWVSAPGGVNLQSLPQGQNIPEGNNTPTVTAITGTGPYTVSFANSSGCPTSSVSGSVIQIGTDAGIIVSGNTVNDTGSIVQNNIFDGSDTAEVQWNPYGDCGLSEGLNNACMASVEVGRYGPQIWRNNVLRFVSNGFIGSSSEASGNLLEYFRLGTNPTGHTNVWEDEPGFGNVNLYYNNVIRHMNFPNPNIPGGIGNVGVPLMVAPPSSSATAYVFNNVLYDMTQNDVIEINGDEGNLGTVNVFNNTVQGGPSWDDAYPGFQCTVPTCGVYNNHWITNSSTPVAGCGAGCTATGNLTQTLATATGQGYTSSETYAFSPIAGGSTIGAGVNILSMCSQLASYPAAQAACLNDTGYAVGYDTVNHTVIVPDRTSTMRPSSGAWDIGAY